MVEYKTMRVPTPAWEAAKEAKEDGETWGDYLRRCADEPRVEPAEGSVDLDADELVGRLEEAMNEISMANDPGVSVDTNGLLAEIEKAQELAEQARDNTEEIKTELR